VLLKGKIYVGRLENKDSAQVPRARSVTLTLCLSQLVHCSLSCSTNTEKYLGKGY